MTALRIALRYLFTRHKHKVINVIAWISVAGVAVATMAIAVVLSVFNGFADLAASQLAAIDPDARVSTVKGKVITNADSLAHTLEALPEVAAAVPMLQERALLSAGREQRAVVVRGIDPARADDVMDVDKLVIDGTYAASADSTAAAVISVGVAMQTGLRPSPYSYANIYMPRRLGRINPANPASAYRQMPVVVSGVFEVDQAEYDNDYIYAPIGHVRRLLEYDNGEASSIELIAARGISPARLAKAVIAALPADGTLVVEDSSRLQASTFRMIAVEKWVTFLMLVFILLIASFNIISTLSLMVIEKRTDMDTLRTMGASRRDVTSVFIALGWLITCLGGLGGTIIGTLLALAQQHFGLIKLGADPTTLTIDVYPVHVIPGDMLLLMLTVAVLGLLISQISRIFTRKIQ